MITTHNPFLHQIGTFSSTKRRRTCVHGSSRIYERVYSNKNIRQKASQIANWRAQTSRRSLNYGVWPLFSFMINVA